MALKKITNVAQNSSWSVSSEFEKIRFIIPVLWLPVVLRKEGIRRSK